MMTLAMPGTAMAAAFQVSVPHRLSNDIGRGGSVE